VTAANFVDSADRSERTPSPNLDGRYALGRGLGRGSSAETFAARDAITGEAVVVKLFDRESRATATDEFRQLLGVAHPSVVRVRDIGRTADGRPFVVTDLVPGPELDHLASVADEGARRRAFEGAADALANALAHLHGRGVIHGDVCPANVRLAADGRAVLLDFGLAGAATPGAGGARGTLGYAAPEALAGARTPATDLFGLGATLYAAWTGTAPFGTGLPAVQRMLTGRAPVLSSVRGGLPEAWDRIIDRLLAPEPRERTPSARELLREVRRAVAGHDTPVEVDLGVPYPEGDPLEGLVVGRGAEREALRAAFERLVDGAAPRGVVAVVGPPGSGRRTLIETVAREVAVAATAGVLHDIELVRGDVDALERLVGGPPSPPRPAEGESDGDAGRALQRRLAALGEALERRAAARPLALVMPEGPTTDALAAVLAGAPPSGRLLLVAPARAPLDRPFAEDLVVPPLVPADVAALVDRALAGEAAPPAAVEALVGAARGHAALVAVLARRLVAAVRAGAGRADASDAARSLLAPGADLDLVLAEDLEGLDLEARRAAVAVALAGDDGPALLGDDARDAAVARARAAGWIRRGAGAGLEPGSEGHRRVALAALGGPSFAALAARGAETLPADDPRRATALAASGRATEAVALWRALAARASDARDLPRAAAWLEEAARARPGILTAREHAARASGLGALGRYAEATAAIDEARAAARSDEEQLLVVERRAWLLARTGDLRTAAAELEQALAKGADAAATKPLRARLGRLLVTMGRFGDALARLEPLLGPIEAPLADAPAHAVEAAVLAHAYQGELGPARALLEDERGARAFGAGKRAYLEGLLAQLEDDGARARDHYRRAYEASAAEGEVHTLAAVALNLGGLLAEQGVFGEALAATERAVRALGQLGSTAELGAALVNAANLLVQLGDRSGARRALDRARAESAARGTAVARALVAFVEGDLARRDGRADAAAAAYVEAAARFLESGQARRAAAST
jgi:serine/threonine-protein kinase